MFIRSLMDVLHTVEEYSTFIWEARSIELFTRACREEGIRLVDDVAAALSIAREADALTRYRLWA